MSASAYQTLWESVAAAIRMKILNRELAPGTRIIEKNLAEEFEVSRGPIREALRQLEQEGLLEYVRNAGCSVRKITADDVYEIYLMRSGFEMLAVGQYGGRFTDDELAEMERILEDMKELQEGDLQKLIQCDHALHRIIIRKTGLPRLMKSWEELNYGSIIAIANGGPFKDTLVQRQYKIHRALVDACKKGDCDNLCRALYRHYMLPLRKLVPESERVFLLPKEERE